MIPHALKVAGGAALVQEGLRAGAAAAFAGAFVLGASAAFAGSLPRPQVTILPSGLTVVTLPAPDLGLASAVVLTRHGGTAYDPPGREGVGLLTHRMILKGSQRLGAAQVAALLDSLGAQTAEQSDVELGSISLTATAESFLPALEVLLECLADPAFDSLEVARVRGNLVSGIAAREDRLILRALDLAQESFFQNHPYHAPPLGYRGSVGDLTRESVSECHKTRMFPSDLVVSIAGEFDEKGILDALARVYGETEVGRRRRDFFDPPVPPAEMREQVEKRHSQATWIVAAFPAPPEGSPDEAAFAVLRAVLSGSMGSRLFQELRDKRSMAYEVGGLYRAALHGSYFGAYMGTRVPYPTARDALVGEVHRVLADPPTAEELADARQIVRGALLLGLERAEGRARFYGEAEALRLGVDYGDRFLAAVAAVTAEDVARVAERYLTAPAIAAVVPDRTGS